MIMNMKKLINEHRWLFFALLVTSAVFIYFILCNHHLFMFLGDTLDQNLKFYIQGWDRIHSGTLPFWDWSNFLGNNYFASQTYYLIGSPFYWLTMLLPSRDLILPFFLTLTWLKSVLCILFTYGWLMKVTNHKTGSAAGALAFTFSAFILFNWRHYHMLDAVIFYPLGLFFAEKFLQEDKTLGLSLTIGAIGIIDYYFLYLFIPFLFLYTLIRFFVVTDSITIKKTLIKAGKFLTVFLAGLLLCMVTLIPTFLLLQNNPRSSELIFGFNTIGKSNLFRFLTSFINPVNDWRENVNYFISTSVDEGISWGGGMCNYTFLLTPFLFLPLFWIKDKKIKISMILFYGCYFIFAMFPMFYVLFNQNYETRWMINLVLINVLLIGIMIQHRKEVPNKVYIFSAMGLLSFILICFFITYKFNLCPEEWGWRILSRNVFCEVFLSIAYCFAFISSSKRFSVLLSVILCFEVGFSVFNLLKNDGWYLDLMTEEQLQEYAVTDSEVIDFIKSQDDSFYRIDLGSLQFVSINDAYNYGYHSFNNYHSVYNYEMIDYVNLRFIPVGKNIFYPQRGKWQLTNLLGSKYWFTHAGEEVNYNTNNTLDYVDYPPYGYHYLTTIQDTDIYINDYVLPFGYAVDKTLSSQVFSSQKMLQQDYLLNDYVILEKSDQQTYEYPGNLKLIKPAELSVQSIDVSQYEGGYLYIQFGDRIDVNIRSPYSFKAADGTVLKEGVRQYEVSYFGVEIPQGAATFEFELKVPYEIYYDDLNWYDQWYEKTVDESFQNVTWTESSISGTIDLNEKKWVVTSVPYSTGWTLKIDGVIRDYEKVNLGFVGFILEEGEHRVELSYIPPGLISGGLISICTFVLLLLFHYRKKILINKEISG